MRKTLYKLVLGKPEYNFRLQKSPMNYQWSTIKRIWHNMHHHDVGMEKIVRLFLASIQFLFPAVYLRQGVWKLGYVYQTVAIEVYVILNKFRK